MVTSQYAKALPRFSVNVVDPGYTATDLNDHRGYKSVAEGARVVVQFALGEPAGVSGAFWDDQGPVPW